MLAMSLSLPQPYICSGTFKVKLLSSHITETHTCSLSHLSSACTFIEISHHMLCWQFLPPHQPALTAFLGLPLFLGATVAPFPFSTLVPAFEAVALLAARRCFGEAFEPSTLLLFASLRLPKTLSAFPAFLGPASAAGAFFGLPLLFGAALSAVLDSAAESFIVLLAALFLLLDVAGALDFFAARLAAFAFSRSTACSSVMLMGSRSCTHTGNRVEVLPNVRALRRPSVSLVVAGTSHGTYTLHM